MAYEDPGKRITVPWGTTTDASTASQFKFYVLDSNGAAILPNTTSYVYPIGVLQNRPTTAGAATIMVDGITKIKVGASTLSAGDAIAASTAGLATAVSTGFPRVGVLVSGTSSTQQRVMSALLIPHATT